MVIHSKEHILSLIFYPRPKRNKRSYFTPHITYNQRQQKDKIWQALGIFADPELRSELDDKNIDALDNIIILELNNHLTFRRMDLWFTPDDVYIAYLLF